LQNKEQTFFPSSDEDDACIRDFCVGTKAREKEREKEREKGRVALMFLLFNAVISSWARVFVVTLR